MRTILSIIDHGIGALCGALQSAAVKGEIDCTPARIAALRVCLVQAIENWKSDMVDCQPMTKEEIIQWVKDQSATTEQYQKNMQEFIDICQWQGTENPNAEPQP